MLKSNKYIYTNSEISKLKREYIDEYFIQWSFEKGEKHIWEKQDIH